MRSDPIRFFPREQLRRGDLKQLPLSSVRQMYFKASGRERLTILSKEVLADLIICYERGSASRINQRSDDE